MDSAIRIVGLCLIGAVLAVVMKKTVPETGLLLTVAVCGAGVMMLAGNLEEIRSFWDGMIGQSGLSAEIFSPLLKTLGIAFISRIGADLCRDAGQTAMASMVEMAGSFGAILLAMPLFAAVWEMLQSLL